MLAQARGAEKLNHASAALRRSAGSETSTPAIGQSWVIYIRPTISTRRTRGWKQQAGLPLSDLRHYVLSGARASSASSLILTAMSCGSLCRVPTAMATTRDARKMTTASGRTTRTTRTTRTRTRRRNAVAGAPPLGVRVRATAALAPAAPAQLSALGPLSENGRERWRNARAGLTMRERHQKARPCRLPCNGCREPTRCRD